MSSKTRFYTRETILFFMIGWDDRIKKRGNYLSRIEGEWVLIDICCITQNSALFVSLLYNLFDIVDSNPYILVIESIQF